MKTASWVIIDRATGAAILETFNPKAVPCLNTERYEAVPILAYLGALNARILAAGEVNP
jgi:hypothetical protein